MSKRSIFIKIEVLAFALLASCCSTVLLPPLFDVSPAISQTVQERKAEGDRLLELGRQQVNAGDYKAALESLQKALTIYRAISDRNGEAKAINGLGVSYSSLSEYSEAIKQYEQALTIFRQIKDRDNEAKALTNLGLSYQSLSQYNVAIEYYNQALSIFQQMKDRKSEADMLIQIGSAYYFLSEYGKSIKYLDQSLHIFQQIEDLDGQARALSNLGSAYVSALKYDKAIAYYQQALTIFQQIKDRNGEANVLKDLGFAYGLLSEYDQAIQYSQKALSIFEQLKDSSGQAKTINNLGIAYRLLSEYDKAITYHQQALSIFQKIKDYQGEAKALNNLGAAYFFLSEYGKAVMYYNQALNIFRQIKDRNGEAQALDNLGAAYWSVSDYKRAVSYSQQALSIFQQVNDQHGQANTLSNLGNAYISLFEYRKAITHYQQALLITQQINNQYGEAKALGNLGTSHFSLSEYDKAITYYQQSLSVFQQINNRYGEANTLNSLGNTYLSLSQYNRAIENYQEALAIFETIRDSRGVGRTLENIALLSEIQNQPELAIIFYKESVNRYESIKSGLRTLSKEQQQSYAEAVQGPYRRLAALLIEKGRLSEAQAVLELLKLRELKEFTRDAGIDSPGINLAKVEESALKQILGKFTTIANFNQQLSDCDRTNCPNLKSLQQQRDRLNESVTAELQKQRAILAKHFSTESATLTPEKLNAEARRIVNAQPGTVLIYPLVLKDKIQFLLALKAEDGAFTFRPVETPKVPAETLFKTIQKFRTQLEDTTNLKALQSSSQELYNWLIKPLEPELKGAKHLVFAPDSTIRYIPLAALYDGKQYLIERYSISTITAASKTDTTETFKSLSIDAKFLLAMGASVFSDLPSLRNVPDELDAIVKDATQKDTHGIYPGSEVLNSQFSFDTLRTKLKGHRILHLATHGKFVPGRPENSYLVPGSGENLTTARIDQLLNYGLSDVHLVVLSACETAVGDRASDGLEIPGISHFFLKNEVKSVIASLWAVNDASTALFMQRFYQRLAQGKTKAEALQQIQQEFIRGKLTAENAPKRSDSEPISSQSAPSGSSPNFAHPYYWAPFILIGNNL